MRAFNLSFSLFIALAWATDAATNPWDKIKAAFVPPAEFATDKSNRYSSPLKFYDGRQVKTARDWPLRRQEILDRWHTLMGPWPPLLEKPKFEFLEKTNRENFVQHQIQIEIAAGKMEKGFLLVPEGKDPFPAVLIPFYEPETSIGLKRTELSFGQQLTRRGFVTLSIGSPGGDARKPDKSGATTQPLSFLGYIAANCHTALSQLKEVDPNRIGIVGHSYGSKWAMFGSCLHEKFAAAVWCDGGIVFDESRSNVNYWEPWYLGEDPSIKRSPGIPSPDNPRTGAYKVMMEKGHDLHELHALMAPRPFLVSGGSEDPPERWVPLSHTVVVNQLLGFTNRVAMTNRKTHAPNEESNEVIYSFFEHFLMVRGAR